MEGMITDRPPRGIVQSLNMDLNPLDEIIGEFVSDNRRPEHELDRAHSVSHIHPCESVVAHQIAV